MKRTGLATSSWGVVAAALILLTATACPRQPQKPPGLGHRVAAGPARALMPSPEGSSLAYLDHCARPPVPDLPADALGCDLELVPAAGGAPKRIAEGVTSSAASLSWSSDGKLLAALADYDYTTGRGRLVVAEAGSEPRTVGEGVGFFGFAPGRATLVFVERGRLMVKSTEDPEARAVPGADAIATFEFNPAPVLETMGKTPVLLLTARRAAAAGGDLLGLAHWRGEAVRIAAHVGDYQFGPRGRLAFTVRGRDGHSLATVRTALERGPGDSWTAPAASPRIGRNVTSFSFSRDGGALAFLADVEPGKPGDLYAVNLDGGAVPERMARSAGEIGRPGSTPIAAEAPEGMFAEANHAGAILSADSTKCVGTCASTHTW